MTDDAAWRAVSDPTRRRLIELLRDGPRTTGDLCRAFTATRFAVMKHLAVLERGGIVKVRREGRRRWNILDPEPLRSLEGRWPGAPAPVPPVPERAVVEEGEAPAFSLQAFVDAPPWRVFDALTMNVAAWWGAPHLVSADATNLVLEPQPGGRFYEEWGHRQGALRGVVVAIKQDERLAVEGAVFGGGRSSLDFRLERREGGTLVTASLACPRPPAAPAPDGAVLLDDLVRTRLKAFVERGVRSGVAG